MLATLINAGIVWSCQVIFAKNLVFQEVLKSTSFIIVTNCTKAKLYLLQFQ